MIKTNIELPFSLPVQRGEKEAPVWLGKGFKIGNKLTSILEYNNNLSGWCNELTIMHEDVDSSSHPIEKASRMNAINQLQKHLKNIKNPVVMEVGCSSGYFIQDIISNIPNVTLVGTDVIKQSLSKLSREMPNVPFMCFDLLQSPLTDDSFDAIVLLNVLEHIENDIDAMNQVYRMLKPGGVAIIELPAGPHLYDQYDKILKHYRRYSMLELVSKLKKSSFSILNKSHIGFFVYPAFTFIKRRNQINSAKEDFSATVKSQINDTSSSLFFKIAMKIEYFFSHFISYPVGIRCIVSARKPL